MAGGPLKIWITRAQPGADATAARVRTLGHQPLVAPLLEVRPIRGAAEVDLAGVGALAFTSANGVRAFAGLSAERDLPVFAVGEATARAARAAGFQHVLSTDGDVTALAHGIADRRAGLKGVVLHPGALEPAGDLAGALAAEGIAARTIPIYDTQPTVPKPALFDALPALDVVLLHSPKAARTLAELLAARPAPHLRALGMSAAVIAPLAEVPLASREFAASPLEADLLNLIDRPL